MSDHVHDDGPWIRLDSDLLPERGAFCEPEHPEPIDQHVRVTAPSPSRRGFLKALGLSAASMAACERLPVRRAIPYLVPPDEITPGVPTYYASTCLACPANCGTLVKVLDGRPVKLEGNPDHPVSRGGLCAIGQADLRALYDPHRLQRPSIEGDEAVDWTALDDRVRQRLAQVAASQGVYVVSTSVASPSARRAIADFLEPFGGTLVEHDLDPQSPSAARDAYAVLDGTALQPSLNLEQVDLLVSLGADPFGTGPDPVGNTAAWAARRRAGERYGPPRHVQIEGSLSLSGANADQRWGATAGEREETALWILRQVASRLGVTGAAEIRAATAGLSLTPPHESDLGTLVDALIEAPGRSLLVSSSEGLAEQIAVALTNRLLGNEGHTLDLERPMLAQRGSDEALMAFRSELAAGTVGAVILVDLDLVGRLPDGEMLAGQLAALPLSVAISTRPSATTEACQVVAAAHQGQERWADAQPRRDLKTLAQPTIRPIFDTRDPWENFLVWSSSPVVDWREYLRQSWAAEGSTDWSELVRTGGLSALAGETASENESTTAESQAPPQPAALQALTATTAAASPSDSGSVEIEVITEVTCRSGGHAANPWLRELPDPLTRVSWSGCARIAPSLAREVGVEDGSIVELAIDGAVVALPAVVLPGQHPDVVALPAGYGTWNEADPDSMDSTRAEAAAPLVEYATGGAQGPRWRGLSAQLTNTGRSAVVPRIQIHSQTEGRPIIHQVSGHDEAVHVPHHPDADLWDARPEPSPQWGMVIDLDACVGCAGCVVACQAENNIPVVGADQMARHRDMYWLRIDRYFVGEADDPDVLFEPMLCAQCDHAPCETVCPVAATVQSEDGLNQQIYNRCVGTRYCANNCPYKVRRFNWYKFEPTDPIERLVLNPDVVVRSRGVMEKCTFCVQRIQTERIDARRDGRPSFEVQTACQQSCPAQAISFGDSTDADGPIAQLSARPRAFQVLAELGIKPSLTYMARVRNRDDADNHDTGEAPAAAEHGGAP